MNTPTTLSSIYAYLEENPEDIFAWLAYSDALEEAQETEGISDWAIKYARLTGVWVGSRYDWEIQGPEIIEYIPLRVLWITNMAPSPEEENYRWFLGRSHRACEDPDDIPYEWFSPKEPRHFWELFPTLEEAIAFLKKVAISYAKRKHHDTPRHDK